MTLRLSNGKVVNIKRLVAEDLDNLIEYFQNLSDENKKRFGPHSFEKMAVERLVEASNEYVAYIARDISNGYIEAYAILKKGLLDSDVVRLKSYGITPEIGTDITYAPSVSGAWQSTGLGHQMFQFIITDLKSSGIKRVVLWGGVQADNDKALGFYNKNGFRKLGEFDYNGLNYDMMLELQY